ncbi:FAD-dependent 5-carboxymethylaminomethyl-2-thiouridine(34) oxidoreductase MnmC [Neisseriaceae bacterium B1]
MKSNIYAWATQPTDQELQHFLAQHPEKKTLIFRLPENRSLPQIAPDSPFKTQWQRALACIQFQAANIIADFAPQTDVYLMPHHLMAQLAEFTTQTIHWQTEAINQTAPKPEKPWQRLPENRSEFSDRNLCKTPDLSAVQSDSIAQRADNIEIFSSAGEAHREEMCQRWGFAKVSGSPNVIIIGAGIAGAATAYELARRGAQVVILESANDVAQAASGNYQGLLYAKISPHLTPQTELLLAGYGYTHRLLQQLLPEQTTWQACGVLHINHDANEQKRNEQLAQHSWHTHLYRAVNSQQASQLAKFPIENSGLFWKNGAWLNPASFIQTLLQHDNIRVYTNQKAEKIQQNGKEWQVQTEQGNTFSGSHIVFCTGADSQNVSIIQDFPTQLIRGQTTIGRATPKSCQLNIALSGKSYISPAWQNQHCFGASFINNDAQNDWRTSEQASNWAELQQLNPQLAQELASISGSLNEPTGHAAIRCDSHDHLPIVGALGNIAQMRQIYAKLALDKNYRLNAPCPYLPQAYANIAHGSRGLATAPICAAQIAAEICNTPQIFSQNLRHALQPNRLIIRQIVRQK